MYMAHRRGGEDAWMKQQDFNALVVDLENMNEWAHRIPRAEGRDPQEIQIAILKTNCMIAALLLNIVARQEGHTR